MTTRKAHFALEDRLKVQSSSVVEMCKATFAGLFIKLKPEFPPAPLQGTAFGLSKPAIGNPILSMYFLVPRSSVEAFRHAFRSIRWEGLARFLLSGPWPPYNFVVPAGDCGRAGFMGPAGEDTAVNKQKGDT